MKKIIRIFAVVLSIAVLFAGCSSKETATSESGGYGYGSDESSEYVNMYGSASEEDLMYEQEATADYAYDETVVEVQKQMAPAESPVVGAGEVSEQVPPSNKRKLVVTTSLTLETKEFEQGIEKIASIIKEYEGYVEYSDVQGTNLMSSSGPRYAAYTIKIPAGGSEAFVGKLGESFHVVSTGNSTQDITESYYDTETRLQTLVEQQDRLLALLEKGGDLEYIIQIEKELSNVRYEINTIHNQLKNMDTMVDFATVNVTLTEVVDYEPVTSPTDSFPVRAQLAIKNSLSGFVSSIEYFVIDIIYALPYLVIIGIILIILIVIIKRRNKKARIRREKELVQKPASENTVQSTKQESNNEQQDK